MPSKRKPSAEELVAQAAGFGEDAKSRYDLCEAAKRDHAAAKAASKAGKPIPATPFLDELTRRSEMTTENGRKAAKRTTSSKGTRTAAPKAASDVRYVRNGRPMSDGYNSLRSLAFYYTKGIGGDSVVRLDLDAFTALLKKLGVADPLVPTWDVTLPNGVSVECIKEGAKPKHPATPIRLADKATPKKATAATSKVIAAVVQSAKSGPNAKATAAANAKAKTAAASKATRAKKATAAKKAGAASKPLSKPMAPRKAPAVAARKASKRVTRKR